MIKTMHEILEEAEKQLLHIWHIRVASMNLMDLRNYLGGSETYHELRQARDQIDACLGNIDEIRMALYKPPVGIEAEDDEE